MTKATEIRLHLGGDIGQGALQYAALSVGILVLFGSVLQVTVPIGNKNPVWVFEGLVFAAAAHAMLNSAFYGRMAGLVGNMMPSMELEDRSDPAFPKQEDDYLSRLSYRYGKETKKVGWLKPFDRVIHKELVWFLIGGFILGLALMFE